MSVHQHGPLIETANQISDLAKGELRAWLEPWFETRGTAAAPGTGGGPPGPTGPMGPAGPPGTSDANYVHVQGTPATTWSVTHALAKFPAVDVVDSGGNWLLPDVLWVDANHVTVTFTAATSGRVFCN
jgi:hypothetical protein